MVLTYGPAFSSSNMTHLAGFVLRDFVLGVLLAILALAVGAASLWYVDLLREITC